jgi:hypothetical protein
MRILLTVYLRNAEYALSLSPVLMTEEASGRILLIVTGEAFLLTRRIGV